MYHIDDCEIYKFVGKKRLIDNYPYQLPPIQVDGQVYDRPRSEIETIDPGTSPESTAHFFGSVTINVDYPVICTFLVVYNL
ncbi:MAG TPA: hypothetical protein C5S50_05995 [Methanosarcinaceae archaeon]|nr:hypothetical protein [Methanosarcinaceae archaeon]